MALCCCCCRLAQVLVRAYFLAYATALNPMKMIETMDMPSTRPRVPPISATKSRNPCRRYSVHTSTDREAKYNLPLYYKIGDQIRIQIST